MAGRSRSSRAKPARSASANDPRPSGDRSRRVEEDAEPQSSSPEPIRLQDLYSGHDQLELISTLAFGELTFAEIARNLGPDIHIADIQAFAESHPNEITEVRAALAGQLAIETAGLWISKKQNRLAEYQADVEDLNSVLEALREVGHLGTKQHHETIKVKISALRAAADELAPKGYQLRREPDKDDKNVVHYVIEDPDIEAMT